MKIIKELCEMITDEVEGAKDYAKRAMMFKDEDPDLGKTFYTLANEELGHVKMLHDAVVSLIEDYREEHGEPPEAMMAVYEYLHEKQIKNVAEVKAMLSEYKAA